MPAGSPTKDDFRAHLGSTFRVAEDGSDLELELISVDDVVSNERHDNYTLTFRTSRDAAPDQRIYRLDHAELGETEIFLVPVQADGQYLYFEAVFNLIRQAANGGK